MRQKRRLPTVPVSGDLSPNALEREVECNIRIVTCASGGLSVRRLHVKTARYDPETLAAVCSRLRRAHGIPAVVAPGSTDQLLTHCTELDGALEVAGDRWRAIVTDIGDTLIDMNEAQGLRLAARLVHQAMAASFELSKDHWRLMDSTRRWFDRKVSEVVDGIEMVGRTSFSTIELPGHGVGIAIDRGHLFRTAWSVADFFDESCDGRQRAQRIQRFEQLRNAQAGRMGTLLYSARKSAQSRCYFVEFANGRTCGDVGPIELPGQSYQSLYEFYQARWPRSGISQDDSVAYVRFRSKGFPSEVPVAARLLRLRVMLDKESMPTAFRSKTTMGPRRRRARIIKTWENLDTARLRSMGIGVSSRFWCPSESREEQLPCPSLEFGRNVIVDAPKTLTAEAYRRYYRDRRKALNDGGIFRFNETGHRELTIVTPSEARWPNAMREAFVEGLVKEVRRLARRELAARVLRADDCEGIIARLVSNAPGMAAVVFDDTEPAAYSILAHELKNWDIKRFRSRQVERSWRSLRDGDRRWRDMLFHSALDMLDQMGCTPWRLVDPPYEASVAIDVGADRRYFGLSLAVTRAGDRWPALRRVTRTWPKGDHQHEGINRKSLRVKLLDLFSELEDAEPLESLLIMRDGHECQGEGRGIAETLEELRRKGVLSQSASVDTVDFMKRTVKDLRMWRMDGLEAENVLEGRAVYPDDQSALICCTGAGTLSYRGTAEPSLVRAHEDSKVRRAARGIFALAQLNYSSPTKAHRYPLPIRETDAALDQRMHRDMRGIK